MKASTSKVCITPRGTFYMDGYSSDERQFPALGVHDDAYAILVLLEDGDEDLLFVSLDVCTITLSKTQRLRELLSESTGVPDDRIVLVSIHSHSCPIGMRDNGLIDKETYGYNELVCGLVAQAASGLRSALTDVKAELSRTHVRGWYSNRNDKDKPFDDEAYVIRFVDDGGTVVAALSNFNCHATVVGPKNRYLTTDVQGGVRAQLAAWLGVTPLEFTGASGDLGNRQFRKGNDFAELARVSNGIAGEMMKGSFEHIDLDGIKAHEWRYDVDYDNVAYYPMYRERLAESERTLADPDSSFDARKLARSAVLRLRQKLEMERIAFPIVMRTYDLGDLVFVTFPGELGSVFGLRIKSMFPGKTAIVVGYANDGRGYFVPKDDFGLGYESYSTRMYPGGIETVLDAYEEQL